MPELLAPIGHPEWKSSIMFFNHPEMLSILMGRKVQVASQELHDDTANRPHVTRVAPPTATQNHFWGSVLSGVYDLAMVLSFFCCPTKVNNSDGVAAGQLFLNILTVEFPHCSSHLPFLEQYVFWL